MKYIRLGLVLQFAYCNITYTDTEKILPSSHLKFYRSFCVHAEHTVPHSTSKTLPPAAGLISPVYLLRAAIHPSQTPYLIV